MTRFPNLEKLILLNALLLSQTLVKRLQDYKLPFIRGAKSDLTEQNVHVRAPLSAWFGNSYLLLRNRLIFTLTNYSTLL